MNRPLELRPLLPIRVVQGAALPMGDLERSTECCSWEAVRNPRIVPPLIPGYVILACLLPSLPFESAASAPSREGTLFKRSEFCSVLVTGSFCLLVVWIL